VLLLLLLCLMLLLSRTAIAALQCHSSIVTLKATSYVCTVSTWCH
jgi:hypothetical protein